MRLNNAYQFHCLKYYNKVKVHYKRFLHIDYNVTDFFSFVHLNELWIVTPPFSIRIILWWTSFLLMTFTTELTVIQGYLLNLKHGSRKQNHNILKSVKWRSLLNGLTERPGQFVMRNWKKYALYFNECFNIRKDYI